MIVDRQGRAFVGNFGFDLMGGGTPAPAGLVRIDPDGAATVAAEDLWFPNGMVITDDGTLIVAETFAARLTAFDIQPDGSLDHRRVWAQVNRHPNRPTSRRCSPRSLRARWLRAGRRGPRVGGQRAGRRGLPRRARR